MAVIIFSYVVNKLGRIKVTKLEKKNCNKHELPKLCENFKNIKKSRILTNFKTANNFRYFILYTLLISNKSV